MTPCCARNVATCEFGLEIRHVGGTGRDLVVRGAAHELCTAAVDDAEQLLHLGEVGERLRALREALRKRLSMITSSEALPLQEPLTVENLARLEERHDVGELHVVVPRVGLVHGLAEAEEAVDLLLEHRRRRREAPAPLSQLERLGERAVADHRDAVVEAFAARARPEVLARDRELRRKVRVLGQHRVPLQRLDAREALARPSQPPLVQRPDLQLRDVELDERAPRALDRHKLRLVARLARLAVVARQPRSPVAPRKQPAAAEDLALDEEAEPTSPAACVDAEERLLACARRARARDDLEDARAVGSTVLRVRLAIAEDAPRKSRKWEFRSKV